MATQHRYRLLGLELASEVALQGAPPAVAEVIDVTLSWGEERDVGMGFPAGEPVAEYETVDRRQYTVTRTPTGYTFRMHGVCDFVIDAALQRVVCHPTPGGPRELIPILVAGNLVSFLLSMRGRCVLHGSSVAVDGRALAFVGASGMGKSTLAAQMCAAGAELVTDDVLPLEVTGSVVEVVGRAGELRLRPKAVGVVDDFVASPGTRTTADHRLAVAALRSTAERMPLYAIVIPNPTQGAGELVVDRLPNADSVFELVLYPRIVNWRDVTRLQHHFASVAEVAAAVPVYRVRIPWGPPFSPTTPDRILAALGMR